MLKICALASGSNGNCYYIGNEEEAVLIDAGITTKQIISRMKLKGLNPEKLRAVFISHEHSDHVRGIRVLCKKLDIPAYFSQGTFDSSYYTNQPLAVRFFNPGEQIKEGDFTIHTFLKNHDASEPCSFRLEYKGISVGVFTDIGSPCNNVTSHLNKCHALFLETNYDDEMLWNGRYPIFLKRRVSSEVGHLSNEQAFELLTEHAHPELQCVFMSHLSAENNTPQVVANTMQSFESKLDVRITSRHEPSEVYPIKI